MDSFTCSLYTKCKEKNMLLNGEFMFMLKFMLLY